MHPEICKIGPFTVYSYGLMLALAFIIASFLAAKQANKEKLGGDSIFNLLFISLISGLIGARIFYILENLSYYAANPLEMILLQHGGLSWFGGFFLASLAAVIYLKNKRLPIFKTLDLIVPFLSLAQAIGRIGCLLNGCCFGYPSESGLFFPGHEAILVPTQLFSSLALVIIFIFLRFLQDRPHKTGEIFFAYILLYSIKRFFIEFIRADNPVILFSLTLFQLISIALFLTACCALVIIKKFKD